MKMNEEQVKNLLGMLATTKDDEIDCGRCLEHLAEYVETKLLGKSIPDALTSVEDHLQGCVECCEEFQALKVALEEDFLH